jgi:Tol biopolymer transport system component
MQMEELPLADGISVDAAALSADASRVGLASGSNDADPGGTNGVSDVFRYAGDTGDLLLVSAAGPGTPADGPSVRPDLDAAGVRMVFQSEAGNLVNETTGAGPQVYAWEQGRGLRRLSQRTDGAAVDLARNPAIAADGAWACFEVQDDDLIPGLPIPHQALVAASFDGAALELLSVDDHGVAADRDAAEPAVSRDGRFVVFTSTSTGLAGVDPLGVPQVFLRDRLQRRTTLISTAPDGQPASAPCGAPAISPAGRYVTFTSTAANLVPGADPLNVPQVFRVDRGEDFANLAPQARSQHLVAPPGTSVTTALSAVDPDQDPVVFRIHALPDTAVVYDGPQTTAANRITTVPHTLTDTGRQITIVPETVVPRTVALTFTALDASQSSAMARVTLAVGDLDLGVSLRTSTTWNGEEPDADAAPAGAPGRVSVSADGNRAVFTSAAGNLVPNDHNGSSDVFLWDRFRAETVCVSVTPGPTSVPGQGASQDAALAANGSRIAFRSTARLLPTDTNDHADIYLHDPESGTSLLVSAPWNEGETADGDSASPDLDAEGNLVVFSSTATNLARTDTPPTCAQVYLWDQATGSIRLVSATAGGEPANRPCENPRIAAGGNAVVFESAADNLDGVTDGRRHIFVHWPGRDGVRKLELSHDGPTLEADAVRPTVSGSGRFVAFESEAGNILSGNTSGLRQVFVQDLGTPQTSCVSMDADGNPANRDAFSAAISANGRVLSFRSRATNLLPDVTSGVMARFLFERGAGSRARAALLNRFGQVPNGDTWGTALCPVARYTVSASDASDLSDTDPDPVRDVYLTEFTPRPNTPPRLLATHVDCDTDAGVTVTFEWSDAEDDDVRLHIASEPQNGSLTDLDTHVWPGHPFPTVTYRPNPGFKGEDTILCTLDDWTGAPLDVPITVTVRDPPRIAGSLRLVLPEGTAGGVLTEDELGIANDGGVDQDRLWVVFAGLPENGTLTDRFGVAVTAGEAVRLSRFPLTFTANQPDRFSRQLLEVVGAGDDWTTAPATLVIATGTQNQAVEFHSGWTLFALGIDPVDHTPARFATALAPFVCTPFWTWHPPSQSYRVATGIEPQLGYWVYNPGAATVVEVPGGPLEDAAVPAVPEAWNLLGPAGTGSLPRSLPDTGLQLPVYGLQGAGYSTVATLMPGHAYWLWPLPGTQELDLGTPVDRTGTARP